MQCVSHGNGLCGIPPQSVVLGRDDLAGTAPCGAVVNDDELVSCTAQHSQGPYLSEQGGRRRGGTAIWESSVPLGGVPEARMNPTLSYASVMPRWARLRSVSGAAGGARARCEGVPGKPASLTMLSSCAASVTSWTAMLSADAAGALSPSLVEGMGAKAEADPARRRAPRETRNIVRPRSKELTRSCSHVNRTVPVSCHFWNTPQPRQFAHSLAQ